VRTSRLTDRSVANIVKVYAGRAGFDASTFSGHSLRAGFLTSAAGKGASIFKMMDASRHKSVDRCQIEGTRVLWASEPGRWRDDPKDEKVFFEVIDGGKQLRVIEDHGDGSRTNQLFDRDMIL
jgi:hypothetical protein